MGISGRDSLMIDVYVCVFGSAATRLDVPNPRQFYCQFLKGRFFALNYQQKLINSFQGGYRVPWAGIRGTVQKQGTKRAIVNH